MFLTDIKIQKAKPQDRPHKLKDGDGLFLLWFIPTAENTGAFAIISPEKENAGARHLPGSPPARCP